MGTWLFITLLIMMIDSSKSEDFTMNANVEQKIDAMKSFIWSSGSDSSPHKISKRSANDYEAPKADELILKSLVSYCKSVNSDPDIAKYMETIAERKPLSARDMNGYKRYIPEKTQISSKWDLDVFPVKVLAQREDDKVWVVIHIAHSETAKVSMLDYYDFQEVMLEVPDSVRYKIVSKARFALSPPNTCYSGADKNHLKHFRVSSATDTQAVNLHINLCDWPEIGNHHIVTKDIGVPFFRLNPSSESSGYKKYVIWTKDPNNGTTFEIDIRKYYYLSQRVSLLLWDSDSKEIFQSSAEIQSLYFIDVQPEIKYETQINGKDSEHFFNVTLVSNPSGQRARLRIDVKAMPDNIIGGQILFSEKRDYSRYKVSTELEVTVPLIMDDKPKWKVPFELVYFTGKSIFFCDRDGIYADTRIRGTGANCVIQCQAQGQDLSFIYITKRIAAKGREEFTSGSYVLPTMAEAFLNVGPSVEDVQGDYECTVVNKRGYAKTRRLKLFTTLITEIKTLKIVNNDTETANITCDVNGDSSIQISLSVCNSTRCYHERRLDLSDRSKFNTTIHEYETGKTLYVSTSWKELKYPLHELLCKAEGDSGSHSSYLNLGNYNQNRYGVWPMVFKHEMTLTRLKNDSVMGTCTVNGERPLEIRMECLTSDNRIGYSHSEMGGEREEKAVINFVFTKHCERNVIGLICSVSNRYGHYREQWYTSLDFFLN